jgi:hypothetical protein
MVIGVKVLLRPVKLLYQGLCMKLIMEMIFMLKEQILSGTVETDLNS